ncbi:MAG TPA: hypothetical protein VN451_06115, partial [Chitinophagaceae bacterium]|nr:hypothetical protein [Chitinophagaceae bacterium]
GKEAIKGLNVMSKTAVTVQMLLQIYFAKWGENNVKDYAALVNMTNAKRTEMTKSSDNDKCPDFDRKNNEFMAYINPIIRDFHERKIEEFRTWLNAYCTWVWYIAGNPKNSIMTMCISWTEALAELYQNAIHDQQAIAKSCISQNSDGRRFIPTPEIPNFSCPTLVKVPFGKDWLELGNAVKNFDENSLGIKNNVSNPIPNHTSAFGGDHKSIAQPGKTPFVKTSNGSVAPGMINDNDELTPLTKIPLDELTPLTKIPLDELTPLPDLSRTKFLKDLLNKMMTADCKNIKSTKDKLKEQLDRMMKSVKELESYEHVIEQIKKLEAEIEQKETDARKKEELKNKIKQMQDETDKMDKYEQVQQSKKELERIMKEMDAMDDKKIMKEKFDKIKQAVDEMEATPAILKDIQQNGLQSSISSGIQVPGTFTPVKGLFN